MERHRELSGWEKYNDGLGLPQRLRWQPRENGLELVRMLIQGWTKRDRAQIRQGPGPGDGQKVKDQRKVDEGKFARTW